MPGTGQSAASKVTFWLAWYHDAARASRLVLPVLHGTPALHPVAPGPVAVPRVSREARESALAEVGGQD